MLSQFSETMSEWFPGHEFDLFYKARLQGKNVFDGISQFLSHAIGRCMMVFITVDGYIFGGDGFLHAESNGFWINDPTAQIFTLTNPSKIPNRFPVLKMYRSKAFCRYPYQIGFGTDITLHFWEQFCSVEFGRNGMYNFPPGAGILEFADCLSTTVSEMELFKICKVSFDHFCTSLLRSTCFSPHKNHDSSLRCHSYMHDVTYSSRSFLCYVCFHSVAIWLFRSPVFGSFGTVPISGDKHGNLGHTHPPSFRARLPQFREHALHYTRNWEGYFWIESFSRSISGVKQIGACIQGGGGGAYSRGF